MAILGVMLAFCAAMVGSARTDLIRATVEQSNLWGVYQAESTKYRVMQADYEMLHALTPNKAELARFEERMKAVKRVGGKSDDEDTAELKIAIHVAVTELADVLTPDQEDEERIKGTALKYEHDMAEAKEDAASSEDVIHAHHTAAEWFERAQLFAEVGIVIASIALLLASRKVWAVSILCGVCGAGVIAFTMLQTGTALHEAETKIEEAKKRTAVVQEEEESAAAPVHAEPKPAASASTHEAPKPVEK